MAASRRELPAPRAQITIQDYKCAQVLLVLAALYVSCPVILITMFLLQAWSAMGNCFSLQKEHDTAIKFLQRSIQLDPDFTYAYTLLGHEYVLTEELDKGMSCFRTAIRLDSRHYNAWYGIAMIYYKQENYQMAEKHFLRALQINPKHSVLLCHLAVVSN